MAELSADDRAHELLRCYVDGSPEALQLALRIEEKELRGSPDVMWRFFLLAIRADLTKSQLAMISAGPFEEFLAAYGDDYFDQLSETARREQGMRMLLALVWRGGVGPALWDRITALRAALDILPE